MNLPRICIVPEFPLSLMTGGTLVQATETRRALAAYTPGLRFELFNWSEVDTPADCYHFIGLPKYLAGLCSLIARMQKPYVLTLLMGGERSGRWRMAACRRRAASWLGWSREHQQAIERASALIAITADDAALISAIYQIAPDRIQIVPVAVSEFYFGATPDLWTRQYGTEPFVLCVGAIQQRKNQLLLARVCNSLRLPLVLVGAVLRGQDAYAMEVKSAMTENEKLGGRWLQCDDALLSSAYAACKIFVLLSASETQPASVLQAMALGKPVMLASAPYARGYPFKTILQTNWREEPEVMSDLEQTWNNGIATLLPQEFTWSKVSAKLASIYNSILAK